MLMDNNNKTIAYQRASAVRDIEYVRNMISDAAIGERMVVIEENSSTFNEAADLEETMEIMDQFTADGDEGKDEEIERIVDSPVDISFDEMIGIQKTAGDEYAEAFAENVMFEGANLKFKNSFKILKKECISEIKKTKKAIKQENQQAAKNHYKKAIKAFKDARKLFDEIDNDYKDSISASVMGYIFKQFSALIVALLLAIITIPLGGIGGALYGFKDAIQTYIDTGNKIIKDVSNGEITASTFNMYRNKIDGLFSKTERLLENVGKEI